MPRASQSADSLLRRRVTQVLDSLRPALQSDGGDIHLVEVSNDGVVQVRFSGACVGCPSSENTFKYGIERNLREQIPEVTGVLCVE
jgi:Fe-S cluster biogenesis protein NfuA